MAFPLVPILSGIAGLASIAKSFKEAANTVEDVADGANSTVKAYKGIKGFFKSIFKKKDKKTQEAQKTEEVKQEQKTVYNESKTQTEPKYNCIFNITLNCDGIATDKNLDSIEVSLNNMTVEDRTKQMDALKNGYIPFG